jgi:predicted Rdx family selenoprotein
MHLLYPACALAIKKIFCGIYRADQAHQNPVLLLSIRRKLTVQYCSKVDHLLKLLKCCTFLNFSFRTLVNKLKYIKFEASKNDQLWDSTVQSVFVWLIKAKRGFDELDQLYQFHEKKIFVAGAHAEYKRYARAKSFFFTRKYLFSVGYPRVG